MLLKSRPVPSMIARYPAAGIALIGSVAVHASVLAGMRVVPHAAPPRETSRTEIELDVGEPETPEADANPATTVPSVATPAGDAARETTAHVRVHAPEPAAIHAARPLSPSSGDSSMESDARPTLHFVMSAGPSARPDPASVPSGGADERSADAVYGEDGVDARPRLLAWQAPRYPQSAASAGVEVDVPVDVVIDTEGLVRNVRLPKHFGYGLDEAAVAAAHSYRFSRATKAGHPVRVRMRCTVMFRLN